MRLTHSSAFAFFVLLLSTPLSSASQKSFLIEDSFGVDHGQQAFVFSETFDQPGTRLDSLAARVNGQPAFFQRRTLETFPGGSVKTGDCTLWLTSLRPTKKDRLLPEAAPSLM